jgi:hypothetical protein
MKLSRGFKGNVTPWGFFIPSILVVMIVIVVVLHSHMSHCSAPVMEPGR